MAREKKVYSSHAEVAHIWAQQEKAEGRASRVFFEGKSIYSYGHHFEIARFVKENVVLFNANTYSVSTGKHKGCVRNAIRDGVKIYEIPGSAFDNLDAGLKYLIDQATNGIDVATRAREGFQWRYNSARRDVGIAEEFAVEFQRKTDKKLRKQAYALRKLFDKTFSLKFIQQKQKALEALNIKREAREVERRRIAALAESERLEKWKAGENVYSSFYNSPVALRIKDDVIQTTRGANVPLLAARELWDKIVNKKPLHGFRIGEYVVTGIVNRELVIGCHKIPVAEVYRLAKGLGWLKTEAASVEVK